MVSIVECISQIKKVHDAGRLVEPLDWNDLFEISGYVSVKSSSDYKVCCDWCREQFGPEHFAWTGSKFWFESEKDAIMFTLRWGRDN